MGSFRGPANMYLLVVFEDLPELHTQTLVHQPSIWHDEKQAHVRHQLIIAECESFFAESVEVADGEGVGGEDGLVRGEGRIGALSECNSSAHIGVKGWFELDM